jgi:tRNA-2-methylthio-N6-dimethylallyladenosine synthase
MYCTNKLIKKKLYIESYGCQMNIYDTQIIYSILLKEGFNITKKLEEANLILINTCSIREKAEKTILKRLEKFNSLKKKKSNIIIGLVGCMAKRIKKIFLEKNKKVDFILGPDSYRNIPNIIKYGFSYKKTYNDILSENYSDINPVRFGGNGVNAFITINRGCDNMCTFCVVPFTRGRERSRDPNSIIKECNKIYKDGYKEITLLGQNVDSYFWYGGGNKKDFYKISNKKKVLYFSNLLELIAKKFPKIRIRFSTSNPHDMSDDVLNIISKYPNICKSIHIPVQSGSTRILSLMNRKYSREEYIFLIDKIRKIIPNCFISHDIITGFCTETEKDHQDTLSLMEYVKYDFGYIFSYSVRSGTFAEKKLKDDVPEEIKKRRLKEIINLQRKHSYEKMKNYIGKIEEVLIEGTSKRSNNYLYGRNLKNNVVVFPKKKYKLGEIVKVKIYSCTSATLIGKTI